LFQSQFVSAIRAFDCVHFNLEIQFVDSNYCVIGLIVTSCASFGEPYLASQPSCDVLPQVGLLAAALGIVVDPSFWAPPIEAVAAANIDCIETHTK
jgi:hypothetical protein